MEAVKNHPPLLFSDEEKIKKKKPSHHQHNNIINTRSMNVRETITYSVMMMQSFLLPSSSHFIILY